jgi:hypothetical protein
MAIVAGKSTVDSQPLRGNAHASSPALLFETSTPAILSAGSPNRASARLDSTDGLYSTHSHLGKSTI